MASINSKRPEKDRAFLRDVLRLPNVDIGGGWLIFTLPPSEVAVHPAEESGPHELYLICEDIQETVDQLRSMKVRCTKVQNQRWGAVTRITLPGGGRLCVYQPFHERPLSVSAKHSQSTAQGPNRRMGD
jgi:hypothetical protein